MSGGEALNGVNAPNPLSEIDEHKRRAHEELMVHIEKWPTGKVFQYLGVDMIVKRNFERETHVDSRHTVYWVDEPVVVADYVDGDGMFREMRFNMDLVKAMETNVVNKRNQPIRYTKGDLK